jgi:hypothetical protein
MQHQNDQTAFHEVTLEGLDLNRCGSPVRLAAVGNVRKWASSLVATVEIQF